MKKKNQKVKPTSIRFDADLQADLDERCDKLGCSKNKFVEESVRIGLWGSSDFNFGDEQEDEVEPKKPLLIKVEDIREFDCKNGNLYENDSFVGKCSDFELNNGKVYAKNGKYLGKIIHKATVELID